MATLHVRSVPEELYARLQKLAQASHRSLSAQVVAILTDALDEAERRTLQGQALSAIRRRRFKPPAEAPDNSALLREDRQR